MRCGFEVTLNENNVAEFTVAPPRDDEAVRHPLIQFAEDRQRGTAAVLMGRLHYRDELLDRLPAEARSEIATDAELALALFNHAHGDERVLQRLEGDFSLVVSDPAYGGRLLAVRDPMGAWPLFCTQQAGQIAVGTVLRSLAARHRDVQFDEQQLASFLMFPLNVAELPEKDTIIPQVQRIRAGEIVELRPGREPLVLREWNWPEVIENRNRIALNDAVEEVNHRFRAAVEQRIAHGHTAAHLSGGMDSSAIVCIARDLLASRGGDRLTTLSCVYDSPGLAPEREFIDMVVKQGGPIDPIYLSGDAAWDFDWFGEPLPEHDEPYAGLFRLSMERMVTKAALNAGASTMLTGIGGDDLFEGTRVHAADLLRRGRFLSAFREIGRWAGVNNNSLWTVLKDSLAAACPARLRVGPMGMLRGGYLRWPKVGMFGVPPWIRKPFAKQTHAWAKSAAVCRRMNRYPAEQTQIEFAMQFSVGDWAGWHMGGPQGLQTSNPFLDPRLVRFAMGLPRSLREVPGRKKFLLQEAMRGVLPEPIRTRRLKRYFSEIYAGGLRKNLPHLEEMLRRSDLRDLEILDHEQLIEVMRQHALGIGDFIAGQRIASSLALIAWYDQFSPNALSDQPHAEVRQLGPAAAVPSLC